MTTSGQRTDQQAGTVVGQSGPNSRSNSSRHPHLKRRRWPSRPPTAEPSLCESSTSPGP